MNLRNDDAHTQAVIAALIAVGEAIHDLTVAKGGVPSGELYAHLMSSGLGITGYNAIIRRLEASGLVEVKDHFIRWTGPLKAEIAARENGTWVDGSDEVN